MRSDAELLESSRSSGSYAPSSPLLARGVLLRRIQASGIAAFLNRRVTLRVAGDAEGSLDQGWAEHGFRLLRR